ncbi:CrcB family protein [Ligilactobacillus sp. WILCCON 0076]|uniref:Fluoride-specific ion channel FluC n=1 Tax=Ligilactobacillus ubinensis TaxID=2876789 RepID=A0A9X2FN14_9LACO|nr:CrcB family protein [Ligilactobacillus ubinensis]MCP0887979.1 CrcB family protein [Ligilactobacillus ubinensis]
MRERWINALSVLFFGFLGGMLRYLFTITFDFNGTIMVNLIGCFLLAFLTYFFISFKSFAQWLTIGLGTGFVGSFTTFSSFNLDMFKLVLLNESGYLLFYLLISILGGLLLAAIGSIVGFHLGNKLQGEE